jgi:hypothetical protein
MREGGSRADANRPSTTLETTMSLLPAFLGALASPKAARPSPMQRLTLVYRQLFGPIPVLADG